MCIRDRNTTNYIGWGIQEIISFADSSVFAASNTAPYSGLFKSSNNGVDWNTNAGFSSISLLNFKNSYLFCGSQFPAGLFVSADSGQSWVSTNYFQDATNITEINYDKDGTLYTSVIIYPGCDVGCDVYKSTDLGLTWNNTGLYGKEIWCLAIDSTGVIYAGTQNEGIYRLEKVVPVELITLTSEIKLNNVKLIWKTATETNNQGFQVERLETTNKRSKEWINIGFVNGNGTTTEPQSYSFVDKNLSVRKYQYRLKQIDFDGTFEYSNTIEVEISTPIKFSLNQNFPNPFNPSTTIKYSLKDDGKVTLKIYNSLGEEVRILVNEIKAAGIYEIEFNATNLPSGVYIYQLSTPGFAQARKMILAK